MAHDALSFLEALELLEIDVLGYSLGGYVAQELALIRPRLVNRLVLAGTGPQGGEDMHGFSDEMFVHANRDQPGAEDVLALFFERSETSLAKGRQFLQRIFTRTDDRDTRTTLEVRDAQLDAITTWGIPDTSRLGRLAGITQPVLVANGDNDRLVPTKNSPLLAERLPNARLKIYPDAGARLPLPIPGRVCGRRRAVPQRRAVGMSTRPASGRSWVMMTGKNWRELDCRQAGGREPPCPARSPRWRTTRSASSRPWSCSRSTCSATRSADTSRRSWR